MIFTEFRFFLFIIPLVAIYWLIRGNTGRCWLLLLASYYFYACWDWRFLSLILLSTIVCFVAGERIHAQSSRVQRQTWLVASLVVNLGILGFFKYFNFFVDSLVQLATTVGFKLNTPTLYIILPAGVSFYTFQSLSYTIDIYYGHLSPTKSLLKFSLFHTFFPQLVAGPIVRANQFLPQLEKPRRTSDVDIRWALVLFLMGYLKKACISDNISPFVDAYFRDPSGFNGGSAWLAVLLYATQIYCDFSGYTDMAIATSGLFGYRLTENFNAPYLASSVTEFWHRWHISLSTWLRDYLYIPLGGNRHGKLAAHRNILITMLLGGLWHGASWNFVLWGFMHGVALSVHKLWRDIRGPGRQAGKAGAMLAWLVTFTWVCLTWIPFRAADFGTSLRVLSGMASCVVGGTSAAGQHLPGTLWIFLAVLMLAHWFIHQGKYAQWWRRPSVPAFSVLYGTAWSLVITFMAIRNIPFIYFQF